MNIREKENTLFEQWKKKYLSQSFVIDGCPQPEVYAAANQKVVFILKDGNLGNPTSLGTMDDRTYDQRDELEKSPTLWWVTIARWAYFIQNPSSSWTDAQDQVKDEDTIKGALSHHCIVQLKKTWGGGSVENNTLSEVVENDKAEIVQQLSIYQPDFMIACGNGEFVSRVFGLPPKPTLRTPEGIGYWKFILENKPCFLIDYCHPSVRAGTKVKGLIAKGTSLAIHGIKQYEN